jgi:Flp pilus assembly pilin Flp
MRQRSIQEQPVWLGQLTMLTLLSRLRTADHGATAIEYGLIVSLIFLVAAGAMEGFGAAAMAMWDLVSGSM